jgi:phosphate transport system permease protein
MIVKRARETNDFSENLSLRQKSGKYWHLVFLAATIIGILALSALIINIVNNVFGYVIMDSKINPSTLAVNGIELEDQSTDQWIQLLQEKLSSGALKKLEDEKPLSERSRKDLFSLIETRVLKYKVLETWSLYDSLFRKSEIVNEYLRVKKEYPGAQLQFRSWIRGDLIMRSQSSEASTAGIRTAVLGSLWTIFFTILFAFPLGVGAAIYLEEYAKDNWLNRLIQTNINNLAGVPSIIYGILGLAIFVRALEPLTSGALFGFVDPTTANGRTILSAGLTLGLLVLPLVIINAQEAIRAVPQSLRKASYGLGATKWQTIWAHVLPNALPGILTGTILAISRAHR